MPDFFSFPARFIADEDFIKDILKDPARAAKILLKLSHIHKNSKHYSMTHNLMFDESFKAAIADKKIRGWGILGAFHPEPSPALWNTEDFESRLIKHAINVATRKPYNSIILTSKERSKKYLDNEHYKSNSVKSSVQIIFGEEAIKFIEIVCGIKD